MRDSGTNCPADREERGCHQNQIGRERGREVMLGLVVPLPAAKDKKRLWQSDSIGSFSPTPAAPWALNMCLEREFSQQECHSERRLCATLTDLYGSSWGAWCAVVLSGCRHAASYQLLLSLRKWYHLDLYAALKHGHENGQICTLKFIVNLKK